jgi:pimeloyl-ACP methyl ester carboxylesterase
VQTGLGLYYHLNPDAKRHVTPEGKSDRALYFVAHSMGVISATPWAMEMEEKNPGSIAGILGFGTVFGFGRSEAQGDNGFLGKLLDSNSDVEETAGQRNRDLYLAGKAIRALKADRGTPEMWFNPKFVWDYLKHLWLLDAAITVPLTQISARKDGMAIPPHAEQVYKNNLSRESRLEWIENATHIFEEPHPKATDRSSPTDRLVQLIFEDHDRRCGELMIRRQKLAPAV